jgi:hypothetical protein
MKLQNNFIQMNITKNILLLLILTLLYYPIKSQIMLSNISSNLNLVGDVLVAVSILAVIACFGNFAFTYEKVNYKNKLQLLLANLTTGTLMLVIGLSLIYTNFLVELLMGPSLFIPLILILIYFACILYDFWDLSKLITNKN